MDELKLKLLRKIRDAREAAVEEAGGPGPAHPADAGHRPDGRRVRAARASSSGAGFYEYADGKRAGLWPGLRERFPPGTTVRDPFEDIEERMLFAEALDTVEVPRRGRASSSVADANIGSIFGIGFPAWTGGVLQVHQRVRRPRAQRRRAVPPPFVARARDSRRQYGPRSSGPPLWWSGTERDESYLDGAAAPA